MFDRIERQFLSSQSSEDVADMDAFETVQHDLPDDTLPESPIPFSLISREGIGIPNQREEPPNVMEQLNDSQSQVEVNLRRPEGQLKGNSRSASPEIPGEPALSVKRLRRAGRPSNSKATPNVLKAASSRDPINSNRVDKRQKHVLRYHASEDGDTSTAFKPRAEVKLRRSVRIAGLVARVDQESLDTGTASRKSSKGPQPERHTGHQEQSVGASNKRLPASHWRKFQNPKGVPPTAPRQQNKTAVNEAKPRGVTKKRAKKGRRKTAIGKLN